MKKRIVATVLAAAMVLSALTACGSSSTATTTAAAATEAAKEETKAEETEAATEAAAPAEVTKVTIAIPDPETSYIGAAAQEFADRATEYSNGTLEFTISGNGSLYGGDTAAGIKQLGAGSLQMLILASSVYASFVPGFNVISVPYMFDDQAQLCDYLNSDIAEELFNRVNDMGITCVGKWTRSLREVTNSVRPITCPDDLKGIKLRVPNNTLYVEFFSKCGTVTTPMNFSEVYNALQLNTLDGQENPVDVPYSNKFYEVQKYISFTNHIADAWVVGANTAFMDSLTAEQQDAIKKAGEEVQQWNVEYMEENNGEALQTLIDNGMEANELTEEGQQQFIEISKSCYDKFQEIIQDEDLFAKTAEFTGRN